MFEGLYEYSGTGMLYADWAASIQQSNLQCIRWIFCPGHAGVSGNERADALAGQATTESNLTLDPETVLALVSEHLDSCIVDTSHTTLTLKEKGVKRGAGRSSDLRGADRRRSKQLLLNTISLDTLRWTLKRRSELLWVNPTSDDLDPSTR